MPGKIFISYRRDDAKADARDLQNRLRQAFGRSSIFMDVDNLKAGQRFDQELAKALDQCDVLLAVMGRRWMDILSERQAGSERDFVREEIAAALERNAIVIPVLVEGASLPSAASLPKELRKLLLYQAHDITHKRFGRDVDDLVEAIKQSRRARQSDDFGKGVGASLWWGLATGSCLLAGAVAAVLLFDGAGIWRGGEADQAKVGAASHFFRDCPQVCPEIVVISAGSFPMGTDGGEVNETPVRSITITSPLAVGRFEITYAEWNACVAAGGCEYKPDPDWGTDRQPVVGASWKDAKGYVAWLSNKTGKNYRLLTEAEWEYSARAGTTSKYAFGDKITAQHALFLESPGGAVIGKTAEVGTFPPNAFGLYDMHGNAAEWVEDCYQENHRKAPSDGSARLDANCPRRTVRGGSWRDSTHDVRSASRRGIRTEDGYNFIGFRIARTL